MEIPLDQLIETVREYPNTWVCFTGGEPLLQRDALEFVDAIGGIGKKVLLETGGSLSVRKMAERDWVFIDMDIKTPSSGEEKTLHLENLKFLREQDYIKFVIKDEKDLQYSMNFLDQHEPTIEALFQPAWGTSVAWLTEEVLRSHRNVGVLPQFHKIIWGERRGV
jgi:7-carboxy-7-deazaguanine synthase